MEVAFMAVLPVKDALQGELLSYLWQFVNSRG